jgi:hypothetical protein
MSLSKFQAGCLLFSALGAGLGIAYFCYRQETKSAYEMCVNDLDFDEINKKSATIHKMVAKDSEVGVLDKRTIALIYDLMATVCKPFYKNLLLKNRAARRAASGKDMALYEKIVVNVSNDIEKLITTKLEEILVDHGANMDIFEKSNAYWSKQNPNFAMLGVMMLEDMRNSLDTNPQKDLTENEAIELFKWQIEAYKKIKVNSITAESFSLMKQSILSDQVKEKFGLEEESISSSKAVRSSPEAMKLAKELQEIIREDAIAYKNTVSSP